ncbi:MAG: MBL fold metallo-hydrolase [Planctomycetota bacterium]|nr:MBL fold metallo-hydrolase [Planctomycetota bacterium]
MDVRVVSIGAMAAHPLRGERAPARTGHATTTLISRGDRRILIDPGLPAPALVARLGERAGIGPSDITDVFLTSFHPDARRGLEAFADAAWWISGQERESVGVALASRLRQMASGEGVEGAGERDEGVMEFLRREVALLQRCKAPDDETLGERLSLFPLPGVTHGMCGLLVEGERHATLVCGDAVPTIEHLEMGKVPSPAADVDAARASFEEAIEVADLLIPGRDNIVVNPTKRPF